MMTGTKPTKKLKAISLLDISARGLANSPESRIHHVHSMASVRVAVPELVIGSRFLNSWSFSALPHHVDWRETFYDSIAPATFVFRDVMLHSSGGIIQIDDNLIYESISHTRPDEHGYDVIEGQVVLHPRKIVSQPGTHISILAGGKTNYFHSMIEGAARLSMLQPHLMAQAGSILVTEDAVAQGLALDHLPLASHLTRQNTTDNDALRIERLIYPLSVHGECDFHPCVNEFFDEIVMSIKSARTALPRRVYIDRRGTTLRPLLNEDELIEELKKLGFVAVRTEKLGFADQVRLFRNAEMIVAPHGAGLTNIGYCQSGAAVLELFMDADIKWYYRRLAAVKGLRYDCLLGRCIDPWTKAQVETHALRWTVPPSLVVSAAEFMLANKLA